tara:strand:+ start:1539 stop:1736 length:198 start_codon:yes stop_codon:yes gene_type:complete
METQIISGVDNSLVFVHVAYVIALVYFVFRNGEKKGAKQIVETLVEDKVVSRADINRWVEKNKKK